MTTARKPGASVFADQEVWSPDAAGLPSAAAAITTDSSARVTRAEFSFDQGTIIVDAQQLEPGWLFPMLHQLRVIGVLQEGWDSYGGRPIRAEAAMSALRIAARILESESPPPAVVPSPVGGLQLEWHRGRRHLEIEVGPDGAASAIYEDTAAGQTHEWDQITDWPALSALVAGFDQGHVNQAP